MARRWARSLVPTINAALPLDVLVRGWVPRISHVHAVDPRLAKMRETCFPGGNRGERIADTNDNACVGKHAAQGIQPREIGLCVFGSEDEIFVPNLRRVGASFVSHHRILDHFRLAQFVLNCFSV